SAVRLHEPLLAGERLARERHRHPLVELAGEAVVRCKWTDRGNYTAAGQLQPGAPLLSSAVPVHFALPSACRRRGAARRTPMLALSGKGRAKPAQKKRVLEAIAAHAPGC